MRFTKVIDVWAEGVADALMCGTLKMQRGQWITCGPDAAYKSRFESATPGHIRAFHGPKASQHFTDYCAGVREGQQALAARRAARFRR